MTTPVLYTAEYPRKATYAEAYPIDVEYDYDRYVSCPRCGRRVSGAYWLRPREVVLTKRNAPDFLYAYCDQVPFVISENALEKLRAGGLTGIAHAEEIELVRFQRKAKTETPIPKYYHIELARSRITVDHEASVIKYGKLHDEAICPLCRQVPATFNFIRSLSLHTEAYEGFDIFQIYELGDTVFLSQRFVDFCRENHLTNLHFVPAQKHGQELSSYFLDGNENA